MRLNHAGGVKQFVTIRESGIERRPSLWNGKMGMHRGGIGEARYAYAPGRSSAVFCLGRMGHGNGNRDCEPARLVAAPMGKPGRELPPRPERRNPVPVAPRRGFAIGHSTASRGLSSAKGGYSAQCPVCEYTQVWSKKQQLTGLFCERDAHNGC